MPVSALPSTMGSAALRSPASSAGLWHPVQGVSELAAATVQPTGARTHGLGKTTPTLKVAGSFGTISNAGSASRAPGTTARNDSYDSFPSQPDSKGALARIGAQGVSDQFFCTRRHKTWRAGTHRSVGTLHVASFGGMATRCRANREQLPGLPWQLVVVAEAWTLDQHCAASHMAHRASDRHRILLGGFYEGAG